MIRALPTNAWLLLGWAASQLGCATQNHAQEPASVATSAEPSADDADPALSEADMMEQIAEQERLADAEAEAEAEEAPSGQYVPREVVYRVSPDGLKIQLEGAEFRPKAEAIKVKGGYGVVISVEASSNTPLVLMDPQGGPMAFGGYVRRPDKEKITDTRKGDHEISLFPQSPQSFQRTWPAPGQSPLFYGQKLELQVGLWGIGHDSDDRRPVLKFFSVRMRVDQAGAHPIVEPPH
jgi:hypothetical protein